MKKSNNKSEQDSTRNYDFEKDYTELFPLPPCKPVQQWKKEGDTLIQFTLLEERPTFCTSDTVISQ
jgi:hypothetical protein